MPVYAALFAHTVGAVVIQAKGTLGMCARAFLQKVTGSRRGGLLLDTPAFDRRALWGRDWRAEINKSRSRATLADTTKRKLRVFGVIIDREINDLF